MDNYKQTLPRYESMKYRRCGQSGLLLPEISLGFWHNFGADASKDNCREIVECAFDNGITYFDLSNNYGPPCGAAESLFGEILQSSSLVIEAFGSNIFSPLPDIAPSL